MEEAYNLEDAIEFADNPEPRCPCILLLDTSGSMSGAPIDALNDGIRTFRDELNRDDLAKKRVDISIYTFDSEVRVIQDFITADRFEPPTLTSQGLTAMGTAIEQAIDAIKNRKRQYKENGITYYRPWIFLITDGAPTDGDFAVQKAAQLIREEEESKGVAFFSVGVDRADMAKLSQISVRTPLKLDGLSFRKLFIWLSVSMSRVSQSSVGEQLALPAPDWSVV